MTISWLKTNSSQGLFLKKKHSIYSNEVLSPNHIGIINMWVKGWIIDSFQSVDIDKISDLKKESICSIQIYCNIRSMVFSVQIFINSNAKIFNKICRIESLSIYFNFNFTNFFLWCLKITNSVFCTFREIVFEFNQSVKFFISKFTKLLNLVIDLLKWRRFVSSAKWWTLQNFIVWFKSWIYIKNKRELRTEPWGTPCKTGARFESWPFIKTNCFLSDK